MYNNMKLWVYYLKSEDYLEYPGASEELSSLINGFYYSLYAYTNEKNFAKEFELTRDMNKFKRKIYSVKDNPVETKSMWIELNDMYPDYLLGTYCLETSMVNDKGFTYQDTAYVLSTDKEYEITMTENMSGIDEYVYELINKIKKDKILSYDNLKRWLDEYLNIFNDEIKKALYELSFTEIIFNTLMIDESRGCWHDSCEEDKLSIYCKIFANTFRNFKEERK